MPRIINALADGNDSLTSSLGGLATSIFGDQAKRELIRQHALEMARKNESAEAGANAYRTGNALELGAQSYRGSRPATDATGYIESTTAQHATGVDDPAIDIAYRGAGKPYSSTRVGQDLITQRAKDTQIAIADRQASQNQWTDQHSLVDMQAPNGDKLKVPKSQVASLQQNGYRVPTTLEDLKVNILSPRQPTGVIPGGHSANFGGSIISAVEDNGNSIPVGPTPSMTPDQRALVGLPAGIQSYIHPLQGWTAVSRDGGHTYERPDGVRGLVSGSGLMPASNEAAIGQSRDQSIINSVQNTPRPPNPAAAATGGVAQAAGTASGIPAAALTHGNVLLGATAAFPAIAQHFGFSGEVGTDTQEARRRLATANNAARTALLTNEFRQSQYSQKQIDMMLPHGEAFSNPVSESKKVVAIVQELSLEEQNLRNVIESQATPPDARRKALAAFQQTHRAIALFSAPMEGAGGVPTPQPRPTDASQGVDPVEAEMRRRGLLQ